jgi:uncharacterized membrane protein
VRRAALPALALLAAGWAATLWLAPWSDERVNDLFVYRVFAEPVLAGALPYREVFFEYPPLAAPAIAVPGLAGTGEEVFRAAFAGWTFLLGAVVVVLCGALAARTGGDRRRALLAAALMPLLLGSLVRTHFDLAPVALLLGSLLLLAGGRPRLGMALLGLAAMTKGFPLAAAPVALAWIAARSGRRTTLQAAAALLVALAIPAALALAASPAGAVDAVEYQLDRPVQVESLPASILRAAGGAEPVKSHRSDGLVHPADTAVTAALGLALLGVLALIAVRVSRDAALARRGGALAGPDTALAGPGAALARRDAPPPARAGASQLVLGALAAVAAFTALGKVLSPQYMLWLVPLGALALAWRLHALAAAVGAAAILTQLEFPARYFDLVAGESLPAAVVAARNLVLLGALALALRQLQLRAKQQLLDRDGPRPVALHEDRVEPRVLA